MRVPWANLMAVASVARKTRIARKPVNMNRLIVGIPLLTRKAALWRSRKVGGTGKEPESGAVCRYGEVRDQEI